MTPVDPRLVPVLNNTLGLQIPGQSSMDAIKEMLAFQINRLIEEDFEKLVFLLYKIDVNEKKLTRLLDQQKDGNTALLLAELVIERQLEKIKTREQYGNPGDDITEEEKW